MKNVFHLLIGLACLFGMGTPCYSGKVGLVFSVNPASASVQASQAPHFTPALSTASNQAVILSLADVAGTISTSGLYPALASAATQQNAGVTATCMPDPINPKHAATSLQRPVTVLVTPPLETLQEAQTLQFSATVTGGFNPAVTWSLTPLVGTISTSGLYTAPASIATQQTVTVTATSVADPCKSASASVILNPPVTVSVAPTAISLTVSQSRQFTATVAGTANTAVTWSLNPAVGSISAAGLYTAPASITSVQFVTVTATSTGNSSNSASASVILNPPVTVSVAPATISLTASQTQQFTATVSGTSKTAVSWTVNGVAGGNSTAGMISSAGLYSAPSTVPPGGSVTIAATSTADPSESAQATVTIVPAVSVALSPTSASVIVSQTQQFTATVSGTSNTTVSWSVNGVAGGNSTAGTISSTGLYSAPSTVPAGGSVTIAATSIADPTKSAQATVTVVPAVSVALSPASASVIVSQTQQFTATVSGTSNTAVSWRVNGVAGGNSTIGTVSSGGLYTTPAAVPSPATVTVAATSAADTTKSAGATVTVTVPTLSLTTASLPNGTTGVAYSATLAATGGTTPYTWSILSGLLPAGIGLGTTTGIISGTPSTAASYTVTVQVTDAAGQHTSALFTVVVVLCTSCLPPSVTTTSLPNGLVGNAYTATLAATSGTPPYTWSRASGTLPTGLSLSSSGTISGTPTATGSYAFAIQVLDSAAGVATQSLALTVGDVDAYGGRSDIKCAGGATTRFYTERIGSRSWLCTPAGNAMWGQGVYAAGPQGDSTTKYGSSGNAAEQTLARLKSWGFNFLHTYTSVGMQPWNRTTKLPTIWVASPGFYGMRESTYHYFSLDQPIKDLSNGFSPAYTGYIPSGGLPDWGNTARLSTGLTWLLTQSGSVDPGGIAPAINNNTSLDYIIGIAVEDSDQTWGYFTSGQNDPFDTQPSGNGGPHGGYLTAIMSPQQQADGNRQSLYTTDRTVYSKEAWHDFLVAKYSTIAALNTAWGSNYTTFDSSATTVRGESLGTTDGTAFTFSKTLANVGTLVPNSLRVYQDGTMIAGDCFHPNRGDTCNPTRGTTVGAVWGPTASGGTVNYSTKAVTVGFTSIYKYLASLTCSTGGTPSCTATVADYDDPALGLTVGNVITVKNSPCCSSSGETVTSKSADVGGLYTYTWTNTAGHSGSESWAGGATDLVAKILAPTARHVLTIDYQVNGWNAGGTGLMDEDGRTAHTWMGTNAYALSNANVNAAADMRLFLYSLAHNYFGAMKTGVSAAFTNAGRTPPMYLGPDAFGTWTSTPRKEVLQAASDTIDLAIMGGAAGYTLTQTMLDYMAQWYGRPFIDGVFLHANADSPFSSSSLDSDYATQAARGAAYQSTVQSYLSSTTSSGVNPRVGFGWWQYGDNSGERTNWGLVTLKDNAYDGHEAVTSTVRCSAPLAAYFCGGEAGNYGDVITPVKNANSLWKSQ
jgi:hypothetical protein